MNLIDDDEEKIESAGKFWLALYSAAWGLILCYLIFVQHHFCFGALLLPFSGVVVKRFKPTSELLARAQVSRARHAQNARQKSAQQATMKRFAAEEMERRRKEQTISATREVIKRLGVVEGYIRVLEGETDPARRNVTFQAAQREVTEISAKRASGEIPPEVLSASDIIDQAKSTSAHLKKLGLANDQLNLEIVRLFNLAA